MTSVVVGIESGSFNELLLVTNCVHCEIKCGLSSFCINNAACSISLYKLVLFKGEFFPFASTNKKIPSILASLFEIQ
jgi:hypothetical protein